MRLHIWHPRSGIQDEVGEDIHSRRRDFITALIAGDYLAQEFAVGSGQDYYHFKYLPIQPGRNTYSLEAQGKKQLRVVFQAILPQGTVYFIDHRVLRRISRSAGQTSASIVLQLPVTEAFTDIYRTSPAGDWATTDIEVEPPSVDQLREEFASLLKWFH